jgi:UDP-glucose 4-epimerase
VEDVARSNIDAMQSHATGRCYNVGRGIGTSIKELTEKLLVLSNSDLGIQYEPAGLTFVTNRIGCPVAAKRDLGFQWSVDLDDGLQKLIAWRNQDKQAVLERQEALLRL